MRPPREETAPRKSACEVAAAVLFEVHRRTGVFAQDRLQAASRRHALNRRARRFLGELVFGVLRHEGTLDAIVAAHAGAAAREAGPRAREALRLGAFQLLYLDAVPAKSAIEDAVACVHDARQKPAVEGLLRALDRQVRRVPIAADRGGASPTKRLEIAGRKVCFFSREVFADPEKDLAMHLAQVGSHPVELVRRWLARHGRERTEAMLHRNAQPPPLFVRVNRLRATRDELIGKLREEELRCGEGGRPESVKVIEPPSDLIATRAFAAGLCTVQDETAMAVAPKLAAEPGQVILDLCAAPGGKATHLAELTGDRATVVAVDVDPTRVERVRESAARLGLTSVRCVLADSRDLGAIRDAVPTPPDRILVDAPCSNSGVIARRPEAKSRLTAEHLRELAQRQRVLLDVAANRLAAGGLLAYSTCSIEPEENEEQVRALLARNRTLALVSMDETLPEQGGGDGGFVAVLRKGGS